MDSHRWPEQTLWAADPVAWRVVSESCTGDEASELRTRGNDGPYEPELRLWAADPTAQ